MNEIVLTYKVNMIWVLFKQGSEGVQQSKEMSTFKNSPEFELVYIILACNSSIELLELLNLSNVSLAKK